MGLSSKQVCGDGLDWSQIGGGGGLEIPSAAAASGQHPRSPPVRCPRCDSGNTKFCYYNNYSRLQPRHFCRACRRHWTEGGTLRNVPVGGGRKNKRPKTTTNTTAAAADADAAAVQLQVAGPFSNGGDSDSSIFVHDVFYPLLLNPPPLSSDQGGSSSSTRSAAMAASYDEAAVIDPLPHQSTTASAWLPPLPSSYCWNWWDDTMELVAPAGFEHPATAGGP